MSSNLWWDHAHYSPQLVERWTYVNSPLLYSYPPGQEQVPQNETHEGCCDEFVSSLDRRLPVKYGCWIVVFVWCNYLTILYRTLLYIKDVTFVSVPWVIICVRLDPSTHVSRARVWPPKSRCDTPHAPSPLPRPPAAPSSPGGVRPSPLCAADPSPSSSPTMVRGRRWREGGDGNFVK
jgi:hypothetical protein